MKKKSRLKNLIKKVCLIVICVYAIFTFINQQKTLNSYNSLQKYYQEEIDTKLAQQKSLKETESNINSEEYIEKIAREKLDMYLPNEKVYIDKSK